MKNKFLKKGILVIVAVLLMIPNCIAFADSEGVSDQNNNARSRTSISFELISATKAQASVDHYSDSVATSIASVITLQSAPLNSNSYTTVSGVAPKSKTVYNTTNIYHQCDFNVSSSKEYRIKSEVTENINGVRKTSIRYCEL